MTAQEQLFGNGQWTFVGSFIERELNSIVTRKKTICELNVTVETDQNINGMIDLGLKNINPRLPDFLALNGLQRWIPLFDLSYNFSNVYNIFEIYYYHDARSHETVYKYYKQWFIGDMVEYDRIRTKRIYSQYALSEDSKLVHSSTYKSPVI